MSNPLVVFLCLVLAIPAVVAVILINGVWQQSLRHLRVFPSVRPWSGSIHAHRDRLGQTYFRIDWEVVHPTERRNCTLRDVTHFESWETAQAELQLLPNQTIYQTHHCDSLDGTDRLHGFDRYDLHCLTHWQWNRCRRFQAQAPGLVSLPLAWMVFALTFVLVVLFCNGSAEWYAYCTRS